MDKVKLGQTIIVEIPEIDCKRFYMPVEVGVVCPHCESPNTIDFSRDYIGYPSTKSREIVHTCCDSCDEDFSVHLGLALFLSVLEVEGG